MPRDPNSYDGTEFEDADPEEEAPDALDHATEPGADGTLEHAMKDDLERTGHVLRYVEEVSGEEAARQLTGVLRDSRAMTGVRQMWGDPTAYGEDAHEQYLQCVLDIPPALDAKQAMEPLGWDDEQLREAVQHEVNRMGYRLNLEIRDRFMNQFNHRQGIVRFAGDRGVEGDLLEMVEFAGDGKEHWVKGQRDTEAPVLERIETAASFYKVEIGLVSALEERDHDTVRGFVDPLQGTADLMDRAQRAMAYVPPEDVRMIEEALEIASHWTDEQILDGAQDYHAAYADLEYIPSNGARVEWLAVTGQEGLRSERTGDCVARSLNEATGGQDYGGIWNEVTRGTQEAFPKKDADEGVSNLHFRDTYQQHGMVLLMERSVELNHLNLMRKHLDLREIPALLGGLQEEGTPLTYIACSDGHAVAVVDGSVHDSWDSRSMGDPEKYWKDGKLVELWVKTEDQEFMDRALDVFRKYETVRQYDDVLTYGRKRRETIPPPIPREMLEI